MAHLAIGTTQPQISIALPFGLTPIMIPNRLEFPQMPVEETDYTSSHKSPKKHKKNLTVQFKVNLCEVYEIPDRITLRQLAAAASPVVSAVGSMTPAAAASPVVSAVGSMTPANADSVVIISAAALTLLIHCARNIDQLHFQGGIDNPQASRDSPFEVHGT